MSSNHYQMLWGRINDKLNSDLPNWKVRINDMGQLTTVIARKQGKKFSDNEIFSGFIKAALSNATEWTKIERVLPELNDLFRGFDPTYYASLNDSIIDDRFIPWFKYRRAGSLTMRRDLKNMIKAAKILCGHIRRYGSLENYISALMTGSSLDAITLVQKFGSPRSMHKLPSIGIAIAAEAMKNIGYDVAKPDRHINRATVCFRFGNIGHWTDRAGHKFPQPREEDLVATMKSVEMFAKSLNVNVVYVDNAIWLLCAKSGLHLSNETLASMACT